MGVYYELSCRQCVQYLSLGKKLAKGTRLEMQGVYSEERATWMTGEPAFRAIGFFLMRHENHPLIFAADDVVNVDDYEEADVDDLLRKG